MSTFTTLVLFSIPVAFVELIVIAFAISGVHFYLKHCRKNRQRGK